VSVEAPSFLVGGEQERHQLNELAEEFKVDHDIP